jgi:hypothetical protein
MSIDSLEVDAPPSSRQSGKEILMPDYMPFTLRIVDDKE